MSKARTAGGPAVANTEELYSRGPIQPNGKAKYRLEWDARSDGSLRTPYLQILWYDADARRNRSKSTGTADIADAEDQLDALYLQRERGKAVCPTCGQMTRSAGNHLLTTAIADYLVAKASKPSIGSIRPRLAHVTAYLAATDQESIVCEALDEDWIDAFREWAIEVPVVSTLGKIRDRAPGTVEASVRQLAAAINFAFGRKDILHPASFSPKKPEEVSHTPTYRADIITLGAMFRYALQLNVKTKKPFASRGPLLRFLQISVATWCRPDAAFDVSTDPKRSQWHDNARALNLNPKGRPQTRKYRPTVPIGPRVAALLNATPGFFVGVDSVKQAMDSMLDALALPRDGETGLKLIRRSMATLARKRLGEEHWVQGEIMLGHRKTSSSDIYALFEPSMLGRAVAVTDGIIEEIEKLAPGAFHRKDTGAEIIPLIQGTKNA